MSTSVAFAFAFLLIVSPTLKEPISVEAPEGVSVVKASWSKRTFRPGWDDPLDPANVGVPEMRSNPRDTPVMDTAGTAAPLSATLRSPERRIQRKNTRAVSDAAEAAPPNGPAPIVDQYVYQIKVLNSAGKAIIAIDWEYSLADSDKSSGPRFRTFQRIKPTTSSTLTGNSSAPPNRVVNASSAHVAALPSRVIIRCVLYSDGTVGWRAGADERECDGLKNQAKRR